ncbi:MAG: sodium:alanine symporter family protein [Tissierellia bacterium]|nr:sodium:alanine symporter family protein [Tissierellia bacterium]
MEQVLNFIEKANTILWNYILIFGLLGTGIFLSIKLKFPQFKRFRYAIKSMFISMRENKDDTEGISSFQALTTAVAAQVGTGNIVGVATAIAAGGPGAAFWMMLSAFFGMSTIFTEAVLAQKYREKKDGALVGGPAYYMKNGVGSNALSIFFAIVCILASMVVGIMVQSNSIANSVSSAFDVPIKMVTLALVIIVFMILIGGIKRISNFAQRIVPLMATFYIIGSIVILIMFRSNILYAIKNIFIGAFNPKAIGGGALGITISSTLRYGLARGLFSNEAGMGSTPHSHAVAIVEHPAKQGFVAMVGVFISTFIICMSTVIVNLVTKSYDPTVPAEIMIKSDVLMTQRAFVMSFGHFGEVLISICLSLFALTTIVGWYYFAESNVRFLIETRKKTLYLFKLLVIILMAIGAIMTSDYIWEFADFFMGLMAIPNILALIILSDDAKEILNDYDSKNF